ncbi:hypothetical protein OPV22_001712 [Ensete ventricosum]|uniref:Uncharacterized protein n=1 Tax=Ensete ventricosum TaxID=4639 RepID=A0AAV8RTV6_ENSVE|nr:hypothetical protein OPV22_001712 [Ensete ventricosum]
MKSTTPIMEIDDDDRRPLLPVSISSQHFFAGWEPRRPSKIPTPESGLVDPAASKVNVVLLSGGLSSFCPLVFSLSPGLSCAAAGFSCEMLWEKKAGSRRRTTQRFLVVSGPGKLESFVAVGSKLFNDSRILFCSGIILLSQ